MSNLPLELCKRLRDEAGWQQRRSEHVWIDDPNFSSGPCAETRSDACVLYGYNIDSPELIDDPNLGELLDFALSKWPDCYVEILARGKHTDARLFSKQGDELAYVTGEKPTIAVANLILEATHD